MKHYIIVAIREDLVAENPDLKPVVFKAFSENEADRIWMSAERFRQETTKWCQEIKFG